MDEQRFHLVIDTNSKPQRYQAVPHGSAFTRASRVDGKWSREEIAEWASRNCAVEDAALVAA